MAVINGHKSHNPIPLSDNISVERLFAGNDLFLNVIGRGTSLFCLLGAECMSSLPSIKSTRVCHVLMSESIG